MTTANITMFDAITLPPLPTDAAAYAGYTSGFWPDYPQIVARFPKAKHISVAVTASHDADYLDVEPGDATNSQAPAWVKRQQARGVKRPGLYTSVSNVAALLSTLTAAGVKRENVRIWSAHYTYKPHLCSPACGFGMPTTADGTQYSDHAFGRNLDASLCSEEFFNPGDPTPPPLEWQAKIERYWCEAWDTQRMSVARRARFRTQMAARCALLWTLAHKTGKPNWEFRHRGSRFHALWVRVKAKKA